MNHNEEVPDFLGELGDMLPADVLKKLNELLEQLHRKDKDHQGSPVFIYAPGSQYVEKQINIGAYPVPPCIGRENGKKGTKGADPVVSSTGDDERILRCINVMNEEGMLKHLYDYTWVMEVLNLLYSDKKKIGKLSKPDKVYLENPNILYALAPTKTDIGTLRETFAIGSLSESHNVEYGKAQGDFKVDGKFTFEIGGRSKDFSQIAGLKDSYVFADDWDMPDGAKLPLWMLGFLY